MVGTQVTTFVLDSSSVLRYIDNEAGADRVNAIFKECVKHQARMCIPALQWGEVAGELWKRLGAAGGRRALESLMPFELDVVPASAERAVHAAALRIDRKIPYADAFALDLALDSQEHILVTADYDFKDAADLARIEFLPLK
jgi:predicted nucleic acid-binding protein